MSEDTATISREEQVLERLAELDLALAEHVHAKALAAESLDEMNACVRSYQRLSRAVRQSLLAKARLAREREAAARAAAPPQALAGPEPDLPDLGLRWLTPAQRTRVELAVRAARPYLEYERPDYDELDEAELYDVLIRHAALDADFLDAPMADVVERALVGLGYPPPGVAPSAPGTASADPPGPPVQDSA